MDENMLKTNRLHFSSPTYISSDLKPYIRCSKNCAMPCIDTINLDKRDVKGSESFKVYDDYMWNFLETIYESSTWKPKQKID